MSDKKCGLRYCDATLADYYYAVNVLKCPCMNCLGACRDTCKMYLNLIRDGFDGQKQMCQKCQFYNGR